MKPRKRKTAPDQHIGEGGIRYRVAVWSSGINHGWVIEAQNDRKEWTPCSYVYMTPELATANMKEL